MALKRKAVGGTPNSNPDENNLEARVEALEATIIVLLEALGEAEKILEKPLVESGTYYGKKFE